MKQYLDLLDKILKTGRHRNDRTGTGTIGVFGHEMKFDMREGFPLITTKKTHLKSIIYELLWFLKGGTNIKYLNDNGVKIWNEWADENGELGPIYGHQWRNWGATSDIVRKFDKLLPESILQANDDSFDQIGNLINILKINPDSRRMIVSAWNVADLPKMALVPCHFGFEVSTSEMTYAEKFEYAKTLHGNEPWFDMNDPRVLAITETPKRYISLIWDQRSVDTFLGLPFNIASYALLLMMIAQIVGMVPYELIGHLGDTHLYVNHIDQAKLQLSREPRPLPQMVLNPLVTEIDDFKFEDFTLLNYNPHPHIKGEISI